MARGPAGSQVQEAAAAASTGRRSSVEPRFDLANAEDEIAHLVCCRDPDWSQSICGEITTHINLAAEVICSMCMEVAARREDWSLHADPLRCFRDGEPCPDEHELDLRILRELRP